jgi:hypothetical protein
MGFIIKLTDETVLSTWVDMISSGSCSVVPFERCLRCIDGWCTGTPLISCSASASQ